MASVFLCFLWLHCLTTLILASPTTTPTAISLSLRPLNTPITSLSASEHISHIAKSTLDRAHHLKNPHKNRVSSVPSPVLQKTEKTPIFAKSYGGYSVTLSFGTPPQAIPLVFDTGSSLTWVPCTTHYTCQNCTFSHIDPSKINKFIPKLSSTTRIVGCRNPKCGWLFGPDIQAQCGCPGQDKNCTKACPGYVLQYGLGATSGLAIVDNLDLPTSVIPNFFLGCSVISLSQPSGIAGFGRAVTSVPSQLKLKKFSYCLQSHKFNDQPKESELILTGKSAGVTEVEGLKYTTFHKNPAVSPYDEYYYVNLRKITVGKKRVKLPSEYLVPGTHGNGGVIVDSGSTFTYMDQALFKPLVAELAAQTTGHYMKRARDVEAEAGLGLCYHVSSGMEKNITLPKLTLHYKGGAKMELAPGNYFSFFKDLDVLCLTIMTNPSQAGPGVPKGPAMILGNYQQMNFLIEYDLENQKWGFKKQKCA